MSPLCGTNNWSSSASGQSWANPSDWSLGSAPLGGTTAGDDAVFNVLSGTVNVDSVPNSFHTLQITGGYPLLQSSGGTFTIATGTLSISNTASLTVGYSTPLNMSVQSVNVNTSGTLDVRAGSVLSFSDSFTVSSGSVCICGGEQRPGRAAGAPCTSIRQTEAMPRSA